MVRALSGRLHDPVADSERGHLLETYVLHELRAFLSYHSSGGKLCYWRTPSGSEIDFVWERGTRSVGIELKASSHWRREFALPLRERLADGSLKKGFGVYLWDKAPSRRTRCLCYPYKSSCRGSGAAKFSANGSLPQT